MLVQGEIGISDKAWVDSAHLRRAAVEMEPVFRLLTLGLLRTAKPRQEEEDKKRCV